MIRKAVLPVAGFGTRCLPASKAIPKEMITIVDKPVIQYVVEEAFEAGMEHLIFVTGRNKSAIEDHFDVQVELYETLERRGKTEILKELKAMQPRPGELSYTRQQEPLGLGHAVWCARDIVGDEPFALLLPDMIMQSEPGCLKRMVELYNETGGNVLSVEECDPSQTHKYGIVGRGEDMHTGFRITEMVEKPKPEDAPSSFFLNGRYILQPEIFALLENQETGAGGEIQITDAMLRLHAEQPFYAYIYEGLTFDCGSPEGFVEANVSFAVKRLGMRDKLRHLLD